MNMQLQAIVQFLRHPFDSFWLSKSDKVLGNLYLTTANDMQLYIIFILLCCNTEISLQQVSSHPL